MRKYPSFVIDIYVPYGYKGSLAVVLAHAAAKPQHGSVRVHRMIDAANVRQDVLKLLKYISLELEVKPVPHIENREIWICGFKEVPDIPYRGGVYFAASPDFLLWQLNTRGFLGDRKYKNFLLDAMCEEGVFRDLYEDLEPDSFEILIGGLLSEYQGVRFDPLSNFAVRVFMDDIEGDRKLRQEIWGVD